MKNFLNTLAATAIVTLSLVGCEAPEDGTDEVIGMAELEASIDEALDDAELQDELSDEVDAPSEDILDDLDVEPEDESMDRPTRRAAVRAIVRRMAEQEECALRGAVAGRYARTELTDADVDADGVFRGRAFRRNRKLVAVGQGIWQGYDEAPGGFFEGRYENFEGSHGLIDGEYSPRDPAHSDRLGSFVGTWAPEDASHDGGNIGGVWHPTRDGRGVFVGYWSRCDEDAVHLDETDAS
ncbi:MAG: hypothetical protein GY898_27150 [Proteobacteria bacterium]|nr:hypothetical protein [Pseudomonadota bacterium]